MYYYYYYYPSTRVLEYHGTQLAGPGVPVTWHRARVQCAMRLAFQKNNNIRFLARCRGGDARACCSQCAMVHACMPAAL